MYNTFVSRILTPTGDTEVLLNGGANPKFVNFSPRVGGGEDLLLWVEADVQEPLEPRHFACYVNGHQFELPRPRLRYIGFAPSTGDPSQGFVVYEILPDGAPEPGAGG